MTRRIVLLRGINLGPNKRVPMPALRGLLEAAGFGEVRTHLASGNVVLESDASSQELTARCEPLIEERFGFSVAVVTRTRAELADIVERNPLGSVAKDPKRYQVTFATHPPDPDAISKLEAVAAPSERIVAIGREVYAWHPEGVARLRLWNALAGKGLGVTATSRNWNTVAALLDLVEAG
ncbi:MAG: DUF1697 domain-containing protein [Solirubrobacteraceae bacterium]